MTGPIGCFPKEDAGANADPNARRIPTLYVVADNIPQAYHRAVQAVWNHGKLIRTQYDRKNDAGDYIDPRSRDAKVLIEVTNPFNQPRYNVTSFCEIGAYIAEIMGAKDHMVVPFDELRVAARTGKELENKRWPYSYHQRLVGYPLQNGISLDQIAPCLDRVAKDFFTRRAVATTRVPETDPKMKEDLPCLGEMQLRCTEESDGLLYLHMDTKWRSRDLFKAWADNVVGLTFWQQVMAHQLTGMMKREVRVGSYSDYSSSLHIYGQDWNGDNPQGIPFNAYVKLTEEEALAKSMQSDDAMELLAVPQLKGLLTEQNREQWKFPEKAVELIKSLIRDLESRVLIA